MNNERLAPIFLDNKPVVLKDPKPKVSAVLSAGGHAGATEVKWLQTQTGTQGTFLQPDATLDRTSEPSKAIYLTSQVRGPSSPLPSAGGEKGAIVDEDIVARPLTANKENKEKTTTPWPKPAKSTSKDEADETATDKADADADNDAAADADASDDTDADAGDGDDERSAGTKSGE